MNSSCRIAIHTSY